MLARAEMWAEVISRLGLEPVGPTEDGLLYVLTTPECGVELHLRVLREPVQARAIVRPHRPGEPFLAVSARVAPGPSRWKTGDPVFDEQVAILSGGRALLPRLGAGERQRLRALVTDYGAIVSAEASSLEPAVSVRLTDARAAVPVLRDLMRLAVELASDPPVVDMIGRWLAEEGAPMVTSALNRRILEILPAVSEAEAVSACAVLLEKGREVALPLLSVMPPFSCVLAAWFQVGNPLDPRVTVRVIEAWASGTARPAARYLAWLLHRTDPEAAAAAAKLAQTPGLVEDDGFVRELSRAVSKDPPPNALSLLLRLDPRSPSVTVRLAKALAQYPGVAVDRRLMEWLLLPSPKVRAASAAALAGRVFAELAGPARPEILESYRRATERSSELLLALIDRLPPAGSGWLAGVRPQSEPDAVALIRRLSRGGADVDAALAFWLDRGTVQVRIEAARALGEAGSSRIVGALRDRAQSWFSDGGVREACRAALERIRERHGGVGSLALAAEPLVALVTDDDPDESVADLATAEVPRE